MKVLIPIAEQHFNTAINIADMINRGYPDDQILAALKANKGDMAALMGAMNKAVQDMGGFHGGTPEQPGAPSKIDTAEEFLITERDGDGKNNRVIQANTANITVIPLTVPAEPYGADLNWFGGTIAEYGSPPANRQCTLTRTPGDFSEWPRADGAFTIGTEAGIRVLVGPGGVFSGGEKVYFNHRFWDPQLNGGTGGSTVPPDRLGEVWPSRFSATWPRA